MFFRPPGSFSAVSRPLEEAGFVACVDADGATAISLAGGSGCWGLGRGTGLEASFKAAFCSSPQRMRTGGAPEFFLYQSYAYFLSVAAEGAIMGE